MSSKYENYNQAIAQETQIRTIEKDIKPQLQKQLVEVENSENSYNKNLRSAVISNKKVDLKKATQTKQRFSKIKNEIKKPLEELKAEKEKINNLKSGVKTIKQLESENYKKEVRGNNIIYYKEDTYKKRKNDKKKRTYREEEFIFRSDGTPVKFIEREDYRAGDKRKVDEEEIVFFDSEGRISQVKTYNDGEKEKKLNYSFNSDGSISISTKKYSKKRKIKTKKSSLKLIEASVSMDGNTQIIKETQNGVTTTKTTIRTRKLKNKSTSTTKVLEMTRTPTLKTQLSQNLTIGLNNNFGINQGTDTSTIPKYKTKITYQNPNTPKSGKAIITDTIERKTNVITKETFQTTIAKKQRKEEYESANFVKKFFMKDWKEESDYRRKKVDNSGGHDYQSLVYSYGAGIISGVQSAGQGVKSLVKNPIRTTTNIVTNIPNLPGQILKRVKENPSGFLGEVTADILLGTGTSKVLTTTKNTLRPSKLIDNNPSIIRTSVKGDIIDTQSYGNFQVESGFFRRTKKDYSFESTGKLEKVKSYEIPGENSNLQQYKSITSEKIEKLSNGPTKNTNKQISEQSSSVDLIKQNSNFKKNNPSNFDEKNFKTEQSKEIFRGEIETKIKDSKGNVIKTEKVPAELIKEGQKQTLYVNGKPFDIKSKKIQTKESSVIEGDISMSEGEFGLNLKKETIETTTTNLETGQQKKTLTQKIEPNNFEHPNFNNDISTSKKQISENKINLLSNKISKPTKNNFNNKNELMEPMISAKKNTKSKVKNIDEKIFEGISLPIEKEKIKFSKEKTKKSVDTTSEIIKPIAFIDEIKYKTKIENPSKIYNREFDNRIKSKKLESPNHREERIITEVFGEDFVNNAKKSKTKEITIDQDSFSNSNMFKSNINDVQGFEQVFKQESKMKTGIEPKQTKSPSSKTSTQEMLFEQKTKFKTSKTKKINLESDLSLDISVATDFSKVKNKVKNKNPKIMPMFKESQKFNQSLLFGQIPKQQNSQNQSQNSNFKQEFKTEVAIEQDFRNEQAIKQAQSQSTSQKTIQENNFSSPGVSQINFPGFAAAITKNIKQNKNKNNDPFKMKNKTNKKYQGQFAGSLTALVQGIEVDSIDPNMKTTGLSKRAILRGRGF